MRDDDDCEDEVVLRFPVRGEERESAPIGSPLELETFVN